MSNAPAIALYARVSTKDKQNLDTQLLPLRAYAQACGGPTIEYIDHLTGSKDSRPGLDRMMADVRMRRISKVVVVRFDRFARSVKHLLTALEEFRELEVHFVSLNENIATDTAMGRMVFTIIGAVAELERAIIIERINAGLERARAQGTKLGRKHRIISKDKIIEVHAQTKSIDATAAVMKCGKNRVRNVLREAEIIV